MREVEIKSQELVSDPGARAEVYLLRLAAGGLAQEARPGQFIMLRVSGGGEPLLARPFSLHGVEGDEVLLLYQVAGQGTRLLSQAPAGQRLFAWGPLGRGFDLVCQRPLLVAGGMGIAPLAFAAAQLFAAGAPPTLVFGLGSTKGLTPLLQGVEAWTSMPGVAVHLVAEDGSAAHKGLVSDLLGRFLPETDMVLACGPLPMLKAVAAACGESGRACQVSLEAPMACGLGACLGCVQPAPGGGYLRVCQEGPVLPADSVDWDRV